MAPRIVSLLPAATEMVCAAGLREQLVGVSHECNWPPGVERLPRVTRSRVDSSADSAAIDAQVKALVAAGEALYELDVELLAELRPTLMITQSQCDVCAVGHASIVQTVAANTALAASELLALHPRSLSEVLADVERIGAAAGHAGQARQVVNSLRERIDAVRSAAAARCGRRPRVLVVEWIEPLMIAGNWTPELVQIAGGEYGLAVAGDHSRYVEWSAVVEFAPELIIVAPCGFDLSRSRREAVMLSRRAQWSALPAVKRRQVQVVDGDVYFNRPGPRLVDSLELMCRAVDGARQGSARLSAR
jgi:iron complex transport system substrate-binding protein